MTLTNRVIFFTPKGVIMNRDQVKGTVKEAAGKVQQKAGQLLGSKEQQARGLKKQMEGHIQKTAGNVKDAVKKP
jgi:uncharacterized protein YjbJ (UPF0337 family)